MDADYLANRRLYDALKADQLNNPTGFPDIGNPIKPDTPIAVTAPPVTTPERTVSTTDEPKADGSTDTKTVKERTTVTPTASGTTVADSKTTYPSQTTTTTTITNNVTNNTTTSSTQVTNNPAVEESPQKPIDFPDDYNKEATQQKIADELAGTGAPVIPDMTQKVTENVDKNKTDLAKLTDDLASQFPTDKERWFSWVWTPPIGECAPSTANVRGVALSLDICPTVNNIRDALGFLFALFGAWTIYGEIFKRPV